MWDLTVSVPDHCVSFYFSIYISFVIIAISHLIVHSTFCYAFSGNLVSSYFGTVNTCPSTQHMVSVP